MRNIFLVCFVFLAGLTVGKAQETLEKTDEDIEQVVDTVVVDTIAAIKINWVYSYNDALKKAKQENKPLLIYFTGSDWCGPCKSLDKNLFETEKFKDYSDKNLILYMADTPRNTDLIDKKTQKVNDKLADKFGQSKFPTLLMVDGDEKELGIREGIYLLDYYYMFFDSVVNTYH
ncbi:thioredoxin family protein [Tenacibaculum sp. UWU-22]|uniref:thioredoxin family protein n=1 Tax=Tenacibaculum sp. UWU-22 TaxID=3234187 RepID=UPI0034DB386B